MERKGPSIIRWLAPSPIPGKPKDGWPLSQKDGWPLSQYLETQFQPIVDTGDWAPIEDACGVLVMGDQITAIEFRKLYEVDHDQE